MTQVDIEAFLAVVQYGTISKAAEKLYISHSTLSWRISRLEEEFGVELFIRAKGVKKVELTKAGTTLLPYAVKLLDIWQEAADALRDNTDSSLSVVMGHNHNTLFNNVYKEFQRNYPEIPLYLLLRHSKDAYGYVKSGEMDAGFVATAHPDKAINTVPLCRENMVFICGRNFEHADKEIITREHLSNTTEIMWWLSPSNVADWQQRHFGADPKWVVQEDTNALESLVDSSHLWTVVPASTAEIFISRRQGGIISKPLDFDCPSREIFLIFKKGIQPNTSLNNFLKLMQIDFKNRGIDWMYEIK
ncbi:MAG: LysR family transcriptional regulator [Oscillospiraceae bacterium]|nr:LysR family transcriptional regulator [Oscillospiraceae bacterium]